MASHFLTKTRVAISQCLEFADGLALDAYPALHEALKLKAGPEAARLFAEPLVSRGNDSAAPTISWYTDKEGVGQPFNRLDDSTQTAVAKELSRQLAKVGALIDDPDSGPLVAAALHLRDSEDVWVVDGRPVLLNWGMLPSDMNRDQEARSAHYLRTLGRFLPLAAAPPLRAEEWSARAAQNTPEVAAQAVKAQPEDAVPEDVAPPGPREPRRVPIGAWLPLVFLLLLAGGALIWLLLPGNRILPERRVSAINVEEAAALAATVNRSLEERVVSLRTSLDGAVCTGDGTLLMPDGVTIEGLLPRDDLDPEDVPGSVRYARQRSLLPPAVERVEVPSQSGFGETELVDHIEDRTAMVLVQTANGIGSGTGFFVGPDLLVTNHHVVTSAGETGIYVTSPALKTLQPAQLVKALGPLEQTGGDFALLRVPGASQPSFQILAAGSSLRLRSVIAAGYPGDLLRTDEQYRQLRSGNLDAVPELAVTVGVVSAEQRLSGATEVIVHSAPISTGNSGGPLIDMCGRLIGVNTFVVQGPLRNLNFALSGSDLIRFLEGTDALPTVVTSDCTPRVERPSAPQIAATEPREATDEVKEEAAGQTEDAPTLLAPLNLPKADQ